MTRKRRKRRQPEPQPLALPYAGSSIGKELARSYALNYCRDFARYLGLKDGGLILRKKSALLEDVHVFTMDPGGWSVFVFLRPDGFISVGREMHGLRFIYSDGGEEAVLMKTAQLPRRRLKC